MTDLLNILASNAPAWGVTLTLVIAGLIVSVVLLYRYIVRLDAEIQKLKVELEAVKEKGDGGGVRAYGLEGCIQGCEECRYKKKKKHPPNMGLDHLGGFMGLIKKVLANVAQSLTDDEKRQARQNIGAGTGDAGIQKIQFMLNTGPLSNPTSVTCDTSYSDIATGWGFNNVLPVAYLAWAGSGGRSIWCTRFDTDASNGRLLFTFCTSYGITVVIEYKSNETLTVSVSYLRVHTNYEEYMILQASDGTFSRNFGFSDLDAVLNNRYDKTTMSRLELPHILLGYNADANPGKEDELVKLDFVKAIRNSNNTTKGYQFSCIHRAEFGKSDEATRLVTYTIFSDNTDALNAYDLT